MPAATLTAGPDAVRKVASAVTIGEYAEAWLPKRSRFFRSPMRRLVLPKIGDMLLAELRRSHLAWLREQLQAEGYADGTIRNALMTVKNLHDDAVLEGLIPRDPDGRWRSKRPPAVREAHRATAEELYRERSTIAVARELGISDTTVRDDLTARGVARRLRAKGPQPRSRQCAAGQLCQHDPGGDGRWFTPRWPSWGERRYCSQACLDAVGGRTAVFWEGIQSARAEHLEAGLLDLPAVAAEFGVTTEQVRVYMRLGFRPDSWVQTGRRIGVPLWRPETVDAWGREWVRGGDWRRRNWFEKAYVLAVLDARGIVRRRAEQDGLLRRKVRALVASDVEERRRWLRRRAGRKPAPPPPPEWMEVAAAFDALLVEAPRACEFGGCGRPTTARIRDDGGAVLWHVCPEHARRELYSDGVLVERVLSQRQAWRELARRFRDMLDIDPDAEPDRAAERIRYMIERARKPHR